MAKRIYTPEELVECAQSALDNWDWDAELEENGGNHSPEFVAEMKEALSGWDAEYVRKAFPIDEETDTFALEGFRSIWDWLDEFANATAHSAKSHENWLHRQG